MIKIYMRNIIILTISLMVFSLKSQDSGLLKGFINKNNIAIRSVQKNSIKISDASVAEKFKELLKLHLVSVKLYETNEELSIACAYKLRQESLDFLSKNTSGSVEFYKLTDAETVIIVDRMTVPPLNSYFSESELKSIDKIDIKNPTLFNAFITTIQ